MTQPFFFEPERLDAVAQRIAAEDGFAQSVPFPHCVIDDGLVPEEILRAVVDEFPKPGTDSWLEHRKTTAQRKYTNAKDWTMGPTTRQVLGQFNSGLFCRFLGRVTGIPGLVPDPYLEGGGMHQTATGGFLKVHADFNVHPELHLDRRLNLLLYLNEGWRDEWGGHFEMWDEGMTTCMRKVAPVLGRVVIFATTDASFHGHPDPLECPSDVTRKSLALYYYTAGRPAGESTPPHSTIYAARPGETVTRSAEGLPAPDPVGGSLVRRLWMAAKR